MKIAIVADTHDNLANIKRAVDWLNKEKISLLLHCGDISSQNTLDEMNKLFRGEIKFVRGNADHDLENLQEVEEIEAGGKKIAFTHFLEKAEDLAATGEYDMVFYGHTHKPWLAHRLVRRSQGDEGGSPQGEGGGDCRLVNPGEVAGQFYKPTFAIYDTVSDKLELKILEKLEG